MEEAAAQGRGRGRRWALAAACVAAGLALLLWRGVIPSYEYGKDWALVYAETRGWLVGESPYDAPGLDAVWERAGGDAAYPPSKRGNEDLLYPPPSFVVLSPFGTMPWPTARALWPVVNVALVGVIAWGVCVLAGLRRCAPAAWIVAGACFAFAPASTSIKHGQTAVLVAALAVSGEACRVLGWRRTAGVLLGLAACAKPQIGLPLLALEAWRMRWRVFVFGAATAGVVTLIAVGRLLIAGVDWLPQLRANVELFTVGANGSPEITNENRYQLLNLHPFVRDVLGPGVPLTPVVWSVVGALAALYFLVVRKPREDGRDLLAPAFVSVLGLMLVYHRSYDALILLLGVAWGVRAWKGGRRVAAGVVTGGCLVFAVPLVAVLEIISERHLIGAGVKDTWAWRAIVMGHQSWTLLALALAMLWARRVAGEAPRLDAGAKSGQDGA